MRLGWMNGKIMEEMLEYKHVDHAEYYHQLGWAFTDKKSPDITKAIYWL